ncbi:MAG: hypothetical protein AAGU21_10230 [Solidesulfovibrio sp.]|uniref:hypothetical protein n=1 Tax=Solidesulfovibrio sp. TaxID=2910990 RepID=UPI0031581F93
MSHVSKIEIIINDLSSLKRACQRLGFDFVEGQTTYAWYGRLVAPANTSLPEGVLESDLGKCDHAIRIPNAQYEVGVLSRNGRWLLLADFWDSRLRNAIGEDGGLLKQAYAIERTVQEAKRRRYRVVEQATETGIRLTLSA